MWRQGVQGFLLFIQPEASLCKVEEIKTPNLRELFLNRNYKTVKEDGADATFWVVVSRFVEKVLPETWLETFGVQRTSMLIDICSLFIISFRKENLGR